MPKQNKMFRKKCYKSIRSILKCSRNNDTRPYFIKEEMEEIVNIICGKKVVYNSQKNYMENNLSKYGWNKQITIDTHPSLDNLIFINSKLKEKEKAIKDEQRKIRVQNEKRKAEAAKRKEEIRLQNSKVAKITANAVSSEIKSNKFNWKEAFQDVISAGKVASINVTDSGITVFFFK
jgi:hypothetical protein